MALFSAMAAAAPPAVLPPPQDLPVLRRQRAEDRLQGREAAAALRLRARQDRAEPHHRGLGQEAARARAGDQARALPRLAALRDPVSGLADSRVRGATRQLPLSPCRRCRRWLGRTRSASNRSKKRDSSDDADRISIGIGRGRGGGAAVRVGRVRLAAVGPAVLSRAAADPDRGARLEPLGGADRGGLRRRRPGRRRSALLLHRRSCSAIGLPAWWLGYLALLARPAANGGGRAGSNGTRSASWWCGPRSSAPLIVAAAMLNFGTDEESFRASCAAGLRMQTSAERSSLPATDSSADRRAGAGAAAGRGRALHHHQSAQPVARRPRS